MLTSAAQPLSHPAWLQALTLPAAERRGQQQQLLCDLEEGVYWADLVGAACQGWAGMGSANGCRTLPAHCEHA